MIFSRSLPQHLTPPTIQVPRATHKPLYSQILPFTIQSAKSFPQIFTFINRGLHCLPCKALGDISVLGQHGEQGVQGALRLPHRKEPFVQDLEVRSRWEPNNQLVMPCDDSAHAKSP